MHLVALTSLKKVVTAFGHVLDLVVACRQEVDLKEAALVAMVVPSMGLEEALDPVSWLESSMAYG